MGQIENCLEGIRAHTVVCLITGAPGIGKTTLCRAAADAARTAGLLVLATHGGESESTLAFAGLSDLLDTLSADDFAGLPSPQRHALDVALLRDEGGAARHDPRAVAAGTLTLLRELADRRPVLLVVDDVQWLDEATAHVLDYVVRRLDGTPIGVVAGQRTSFDGRSPPVDLMTAAAEDTLWRIDLEPLDPASTHELIRDRMPWQPNLRRVRRLADLAAGNPLFAVELARFAAADHDDDDGHEELLPEALSDLVRARVSGLSPEARELLLITAVTHRPTVARVARAVSRPVGQVVSGLDEAVDAGVLMRVSGSGELVFTHPLFAVGVVAVSPPGTRREAHRRAAVVAEGLEERAGHLAMAALEPDRDLADMLDRAAEHSLNRGAPETAAALAQDALRLTPTDTAIDSYRRAVTVAEYQFHAGDVTRARETLEDLLRRPAPKPERARALRVLGELLYHQDSYADAVEPLTQALTLTTDPDLRGHLLIHLAFADAGSGRFQEAREHAHAALLLADHVSDPGLLGSIFAVAAITDRLNGELLDERLLARALELEDPNQQRATALRPSLIAGHLRLYAGQLAQAEHHLTTILEEAVERGNESDVVLAAATLVWAECWSGDLDSAHAHARQAITTAERLGGDLGVCLACSFATVQYVFRGDLEAAGGCATRALALTEVSGYPVGSLWVWWGQAVGALAAGQPEEGAEAAEGMLNVVDLTGLPIPARVMGLADAIEVLVEMRQLDRADHYIDILLEAAERTQTAWARMTGLRCRALGHAAHGDLDRAETAVTEALRRADDSELVVEVARTHLVAGQIIRRRRRKREAAAHIEQALSAFEDAGAEGWATLAAAELARARPRTTDTLGLSPTEERVAHLVASGLTNSEVANRLNISTKTVEANLTRIYHKLQIRSRAELGTHLAPLP